MLIAMSRISNRSNAAGQELSASHRVRCVEPAWKSNGYSDPYTMTAMVMNRSRPRGYRQPAIIAGPNRDPVKSVSGFCHTAGPAYGQPRSPQIQLSNSTVPMRESSRNRGSSRGSDSFAASAVSQVVALQTPHSASHGRNSVAYMPLG